MAGALNLVGALSGEAVAKTVGSGIVDKTVVTQDIVVAALIGAIIWDLITFVAALPTSSSHALIFSVIGAAVSVHGLGVIIAPGLQLTVFGIGYSPVVAFIFGYALMLGLYWALRNVSYRFVNRFFGRAQIVSSAYMAFSHGGNDGQKTMGVIALAIYAFHGSTGPFVIDTWVKVVCALAIGLGTATGGWRIIRTMGMRITALKPVNGFAAETAAATVIEIATRFGIPISTTHAISGAIRGDEDPLVLFADLVGALRRDTAAFGEQLTSFLDQGSRLERRLGQLAQALADELAPLGELIFFLDDHPGVRGGAPLAAFGNELLELLPENAHLVLATRRTPQLGGLPRWRLGGSALDISAAELAFTRSEAVELLRREFALDLPEHAIDAMYSRTGGWPAGLRLAAAFVSERGWQQLGEFQGGGAELYAYFNSEVLRRGSRRDQNTILRWSLLDRIEDDVEVTAGGASRELLASLEQAGLVVRDSADAGHRFQPLYAEFLRSRARELLPAAEIVELHRGHAERAAARGDVDRAIHHFQQAGDHRRAAQLVRDHGERALQGSEVATLQRWLDGFPPGAERRLPWVILLRGLLHRVRGDYERALANYGDAAAELRRARRRAHAPR